MPNVLYNNRKKDSSIEVINRKPGVSSSDAFMVNKGNAMPTSARGFSFQPPIIKVYRAGETLSAGDAVFIATGDGSKNTHAVDIEIDSVQYLSVADSASLSITGNMTFECWVKLESNPGVGDRRIFCAKWDSVGSKKSYIFGYQNPAGTYQILFGTSNDGSAQNMQTINYTLTLGTWTHIAIAYNASAGTAECYINGTSIGTITGLHTSIHDNNSEFWVGGRTGGVFNNEFYDGMLDDMRLWNTTRTAPQISVNYRIQMSGTESGLAAYWRFNNNALDTTSNGNNLTNNGATFSDQSIPFVGGTAFKAEADVNGRHETFVGFSQKDVSEGGKATIVIAGEVGGFSGLTIGTQYYLSDTAGAISTTPGTNTRKVGIASSSTTIVITNNW